MIAECSSLRPSVYVIGACMNRMLTANGKRESGLMTWRKLKNSKFIIHISQLISTDHRRPESFSYCNIFNELLEAAVNSWSYKQNNFSFRACTWKQLRPHKHFIPVTSNYCGTSWDFINIYSFVSILLLMSSNHRPRRLHGQITAFIIQCG